MSCVAVRGKAGQGAASFERGVDRLCDNLEVAATVMEDAIDSAVDRVTLRPPTSVHCTLSERELQQADDLFWSLAEQGSEDPAPTVLVGDALLLALHECGFALPSSNQGGMPGGMPRADPTPTTTDLRHDILLRELLALPIGHWRRAGDRAFTLQEFRDLLTLLQRPRLLIHQTTLPAAEPLPAVALLPIPAEKVLNQGNAT